MTVAFCGFATTSRAAQPAGRLPAQSRIFRLRQAPPWNIVSVPSVKPSPRRQTKIRSKSEKESVQEIDEAASRFDESAMAANDLTLPTVFR